MRKVIDMGIDIITQPLVEGMETAAAATGVAELPKVAREALILGQPQRMQPVERTPETEAIADRGSTK